MGTFKHLLIGFIFLTFLIGAVGLMQPPPSQADVQFEGIKKILKNIFPPCGPGTRDQRFVVSKDGTSVCDNKTGLWWQQTPGQPPDANCSNTNPCKWNHANDYCTNLELTGRHKKKQWRLTEVKELISFVDYSEPNSATALNMPNGPFQNVRDNDFYWSAQGLGGSPPSTGGEQYSVNFFLGFLTSNAQGGGGFLSWCVSGEQDAN